MSTYIIKEMYAEKVKMTSILKQGEREGGSE
jgi:hypothetical protein